MQEITGTWSRPDSRRCVLQCITTYEAKPYQTSDKGQHAVWLAPRACGPKGGQLAHARWPRHATLDRVMSCWMHTILSVCNAPCTSKPTRAHPTLHTCRFEHLPIATTCWRLQELGGCQAACGSFSAIHRRCPWERGHSRLFEVLARVSISLLPPTALPLSSSLTRSPGYGCSVHFAQCLPSATDLSVAASILSTRSMGAHQMRTRVTANTGTNISLPTAPDTTTVIVAIAVVTALPSWLITVMSRSLPKPIWLVDRQSLSLQFSFKSSTNDGRHGWLVDMISRVQLYAWVI